MVKKGAASNAWEDDWETQADRLDDQPQQSEPQVPLSKAERLARHAELNRKLWEEADSPAPLHFIDSQPSVPLATGFKPQVKVLSRKPAPQMIARRDPVTGLSQLSLADDDDDKATEKKPQLTPEEIRAKQQRELEEKQRRYEEARAKIFGESNPSSGASSPGTVTPPRGPGDGGRGSQRGRGRGRGGGHRGNSSRQEDRRPVSRPDAGRSESGRELYDPNFAPRGGVSLQKRGGDSGHQSGRSTPRDDDQPRQAIRSPRGPDGSGRGGFGFANRGTREG
ncbi:hypothetical protein COL154_013150 [Colletotrichum chrysophilum]|uniref:SUZ RNA-binding domain-containing n=1 Tax=Colletotrichum chrysophilum TaxID=1836956 RepID=A0AAD9A9W2_9PEZI|nr:uncharacterized protein COL26b_001863 [Colletotrichum chrysophilum]KAJ0350863.1 hypothetical protein COL154_013150 [Colletotrichum chrysophilum]KAJ0355087.1 hypothetical protein KNSL1_000806 [Colletotrichum chrysophilum]KAJ0379713.1 hypothetical protein COL26b_001863 [Colletotrichum chrysophilum]KAK1843605.1 hypothetical protein CCHR01_13752 [Colletotrichum chrysophilum]